MNQVEVFRNYSERKITRRRALQLLGAIPVGLALNACFANESSHIQTISERIRAFENSIGNKNPTLSEALEFVPLVANFFSEETRSIQSPEEIAKNTFLIWDEPPYIENPSGDSTGISSVLASEWFAQLKKSYPDSDITDSNVRSILSFYWSRSSDAFIDNDRKIFIFNWKNREGLAKTLTGGNELNQYRGISPQTECTPLVPIVRLRSSLLHEISHRETDTIIKPAEIELAESFNQQFKIFDKITSAKKQGFRLMLAGDDNKRYIEGLNEFFAMYMLSRISSDAGLFYSIGPGPEPVDIFNFTQVLKQANIKDKKLLRLHRNSAIVELLMQIARSSKNVNLSTQRELLDFGVWFMGNINDWNKLKTYFPAIDDRNYNYSGKVLDNQTAGCISK